MLQHQLTQVHLSAKRKVQPDLREGLDFRVAGLMSKRARGFALILYEVEYVDFRKLTSATSACKHLILLCYFCDFRDFRKTSAKWFLWWHCFHWLIFQTSADFRRLPQANSHALASRFRRWRGPFRPSCRTIGSRC